MVPVVGLEPTRPRGQRIFLLLYVAIAALLRCSLDYVFTISYDLGGSSIVSTHLNWLERLLYIHLIAYIYLSSKPIL